MSEATVKTSSSSSTTTSTTTISTTVSLENKTAAARIDNQEEMDNEELDTETREDMQTNSGTTLEQIFSSIVILLILVQLQIIPVM